ncbi:MAG: glucosamine-6-phosphate deaminase [Saprospiraceae bacterium]|nr:glucosamine-6-phosphate deaminase [Saprospiraceae bacterium]
MDNQLEKINTLVYETSKEASCVVAGQIADLIRQKAAENKPCVLGLATGSTPTSVYAELVRLHKEEGLSFKNVVTFNLDEYYPMAADALQSYVRFMHELLFDSVDILPENINIPDGTVAKTAVADYCKGYEDKIKSYGGLDLQILGIGRTGHIGFNEPGSGQKSRTRMVTLDHLTITDAASDFFGEEFVPRKAITMGVGTIMEAKQIILMAWGEGKSHIIRKTVEGDISDHVPATYLQNHGNTTFYLDAAAASELTRYKTPWLVRECDWTDQHLIKRALIWLSQKEKKPILKLTTRDYAENGMSDLVTEYDSAYNINVKVFNQLRHTITGWPGGKQNDSYVNRPEPSPVYPKRVIIFSPHPDDDVISMGGTFIRLSDHGHEVHVAYQTSGNIAVFDDDVVRFADFMNDFTDMFGLDKNTAQTMFNDIQEKIKNKKAGEVDAPEVQKIKGLIRRGEAKAGCRYVSEKVVSHFLDMPFYETGTIKKKPLSTEDIQIIKDLLTEVKPHQVYAAGDLSDPHGTHRVCLDAIFRAIQELKHEEWMQECSVWLYRGAWHEWEIENIDMAVPLSPDELLRKRRAIFKHQSQKDRPLFPGSDSREFWQRAEERNRGTAKAFDALGFPEYEAIEAFKRWHF